MEIVVCIKQVPETTEVKINPQTNTLIREGVKSIINPFDMYALEEAIRLKEKYSGKTIVITMGPPQAESALREALAMGIDEGILITDRTFAGSDTWATSYTLSKAILKIGNFDLVLCGKQASDGDTAQVGPGISAHLDIPQVTYVKKIREINNKNCIVERMTEEGYEVILTPLPCVLTVVKEINEPRLPSLRGLMRAKQTQIIRWSARELKLDEEKIGLKGSPTQVVKIFSPPQRKGGVVFKGETSEVVDKLISLLKDQLP
ncbi:MAG: electron transfer flavoprotein subunit beta/FixA family protein [Candidatus Omnitrophica bacterium]|nr:electron transfer flavoprotein subunit beta/FixA family protein [Candidatus Omnitrophota bacterium]